MVKIRFTLKNDGKTYISMNFEWFGMSIFTQSGYDKEHIFAIKIHYAFNILLPCSFLCCLKLYFALPTMAKMKFCRVCRRIDNFYYFNKIYVPAAVAYLIAYSVSYEKISKLTKKKFCVVNQSSVCHHFISWVLLKTYL
jgi:hypothetical protein